MFEAWSANIHGSQDGRDSCGSGADAISISEEEDPGVFTLGTFVGFHPLTSPHASPQTLQETKASLSSIAPIMFTHDRLNGLGSLVGVVEGNGANIVVEHVRLDDAVQEGSANESEFSIYRGSCTTGICPCGRCIVR